MPADEYDECPQTGQVFRFGDVIRGNGFLSLMNYIDFQVWNLCVFSLAVFLGADCEFRRAR
jgi:hypothetical protein